MLKYQIELSKKHFFIERKRKREEKGLMGENEEEEPSSQNWGQQAWIHLSALRLSSPLIQCITNFVSMDIIANSLLAAGASPAMVHSLAEIPEFTPRTAAVLINVGTLAPDWVPSMLAAAEAAKEAGRPWVLDPVAAGATGFRLRVCLEIMGMGPTVVRGNGSEILALANASANQTKGVDSSHESSDAIEAAKSLAKSHGFIVAVSGAVDYVTDGHRIVGVRNGVPMMQKITATGCSVTALITAFVAIDTSHAFEATVSALALFGLAGELGMEQAKGPASLRTHLIDSLYGLDEDTVVRRVNVVDNF